jgi:hypothetical protein
MSSMTLPSSATARMCFRCLDNTAEVIEAPDIHEAVHPARAEALIDLA